jgi:hypothetical protein
VFFFGRGIVSARVERDHSNHGDQDSDAQRTPQRQGRQVVARLQDEYGDPEESQHRHEDDEVPSRKATQRVPGAFDPRRRNVTDLAGSADFFSTLRFLADFAFITVRAPFQEPTA